MAYGQQPQAGSRDSITQTLMSILRPQPRPNIPQMPLQQRPPDVPPQQQQQQQQQRPPDAPPSPQQPLNIPPQQQRPPDVPPPYGYAPPIPTNVRGGMYAIGDALGQRYNPGGTPSPFGR